ncbi:hypothetical protein [Paenibacillus eucommiae]|uniref:Uncharacterized protein n=1 Tax=Paenibacillus eucommiae TaxID=1355755 RepID=A0ABS4J544_9BACL|nr:hypothetical protein [Paenibacillus eucommiae]MBP1994952.1 hypothetical protein [Paenibacillus eucommiae]
MSEPSDWELERLERQLKKPLSGYLSTSPKADATQQLLRSLQGEFDLLREKNTPFEWKDTRDRKQPSLWKQCMLQLQTYNKSFWLVSVLAYIMITAVGHMQSSFILGLNDIFSIAIPLLLLGGIGYSHRSWNKEMRMVESVTPFPPALLFLCRLLIVVSFHVLMGSIGSVYVFMVNDNPLFVPQLFLLNWLAPVLFLGGLLAFISFRWGIISGFAAAIMIWFGWGGALQWLEGSEWLTPLWMYAIYCGAAGGGVVLFTAAYRRSLTLQRLDLGRGGL